MPWTIDYHTYFIQVNMQPCFKHLVTVSWYVFHVDVFFCSSTIPCADNQKLTQAWMVCTNDHNTASLWWKQMTISFKILRTIDWSKVDIWLLDMEIAHDPAGRYWVFNKRVLNCFVCNNDFNNGHCCQIHIRHYGKICIDWKHKDLLSFQ